MKVVQLEGAVDKKKKAKLDNFDDASSSIHPDYFTIKVYHGGYIEHEDSKYIGATVSYYDNVDKDKMSLTEVDGMVRGIKSEYVGTRIDYWYSIGSEEDAMSKLNNDSNVIRMCCMESQESKDSWDWFLRLLVKDLEITRDGSGWTFISDKQKGLLPACEVVVPLAEHRFCVRHLSTNFNKLFPGKVFKDQVWAIAKATTMAYYTKELVLMKQMDPKAYDWLTDPLRPQKHWSKAHFGTTLKCDVLLNNLCESFNAFILPARSKPVISCFEGIMVKMMKMIAMRRDKISKVVEPICPKPRELLKKNKIKSATDCIPYGSSSPQIEVESLEDPSMWLT
ncbi:uncharacterized protein LOC112184209 [Rosa chinensis]|uniref:uncharacterized protein LOC112184209 n=1 Tax=Rosa chinensis TaxID=74649 RepID=UPI000D08DE0B|nr:uncharacterized protein LOC112184209 [Rosa chinensis]